MGPSGPVERGALGPSGPLERGALASGPLRLSPQVALRSEPFGALAYHYGNRRLSFLRSPELVALVRSLGEHAGTDEALVASGIDPARWPAYRRALAGLVESEVLCGQSERAARAHR